MSPLAPVVSVGLIVFNGERYLRATIESILAQEFSDFELIISDNGSTDSTEQICREYAARDSRVRYSRSAVNHGAVWNCNRVIELARGRYFKLATHDDVLAPSYLRRCMETFESAPASVVLVYPRTRLIGPDGEEIGDYDDRLDLRMASPAQRLGHLIRNVRLCNAVAGLIRLDVLRQTGRFQELTQSDNLLLAELCLRGQLWEVPERLYLRRIHSGSSSRVYPSLRKRMQWISPHTRSKASSFPVTRLLLAHLLLIARAPISIRERWKALTIFVPSHLLARVRYRKSQLRGYAGRVVRAVLNHNRAVR